LFLLERIPHCGVVYRHQIVPRGSTSYIVFNGSNFNLYSDDSFQFFGRRNFNMALEYLLECVFQAALAVQKWDRTIALPYAIVRKKSGELTVGGLSVAFGQDGVEWTRAMKYLLTNVKQLLAFRGFDVWQTLGNVGGTG
jgi:hypothetical protein